MRKPGLVLLLLLLITGIVLYAGGLRPGRREPINFSDPAEIIKTAQAKAGQVENYRYQTELAMGDQIRIAVANRVIKQAGNKKTGKKKTGEKETGRQMTELSWTIPKKSGTAAIYREGERLYFFHPLKDRWLLPGEEPTIKPFLDFFGRQTDLVDPVENLLRVEAGGKNISLSPVPGEAGGDTVTVQVIPRAGALSDLIKALPPQLSGAELTDLKQIFRISRQDLLVTQYEVRARVNFFGLKTMDFKAVSKALDYNKTRIDLPKPLLDKMNQGK